MILVNATNVRSLAIGRVFRHFAGCKTITGCTAFLDDPTTEPYPEALPGGFFDLLARRNELWAAGKDDEAEPLTALINNRLEQAQRDRATRTASPQEQAAHA